MSDAENTCFLNLWCFLLVFHNKTLKNYDSLYFIWIPHSDSEYQQCWCAPREPKYSKTMGVGGRTKCLIPWNAAQSNTKVQNVPYENLHGHTFHTIVWCLLAVLPRVGWEDWYHSHVSSIFSAIKVWCFEGHWSLTQFCSFSCLTLSFCVQILWLSIYFMTIKHGEMDVTCLLIKHNYFSVQGGSVFMFMMVWSQKTTSTVCQETNLLNIITIKCCMLKSVNMNVNIRGTFEIQYKPSFLG